MNLKLGMKGGQNAVHHGISFLACASLLSKFCLYNTKIQTASERVIMLQSISRELNRTCTKNRRRGSTGLDTHFSFI